MGWYGQRGWIGAFSHWGATRRLELMGGFKSFYFYPPEPSLPGHVSWIRAPNQEIKDEDLEIVIELYQVDRQPMRDVLPRLLKSELDIEQTNRKDAEAESDRLRALIHAASNQATNRVCHLTRSALKIQAKWRQVMVHHQFQRDRAETDRRLKQAKFVKAITVLQCLWRLRRKKCERRWLRAQKGCSETETPYDAILVHLGFA